VWIAYHFWSPTWPPCAHIKPAIEQMKEDFPSVTWEAVNTHDDTKGIARTMGVQAVPTVVLYKNGVEVARHSGTTIITYYSILRKALAA
jgi:thioredoxin-like negative regulator of GroEL